MTEINLKKDKDLNPSINTLIVNSGMHMASLRLNLGFKHRQFIFENITKWKLNSVVVDRTERLCKFQKSLVQKKIKAKNKKKAITNANFLKNKTTSKRRKEAEEGYIDCKTQAKILMKSQKKYE